MKIYSHRGNLKGPIPAWENHPDFIQEALDEKFMVEVDCWYFDESVWFGHDKPIYPVKWDFIQQNKYMMILHVKSFNTIKYLRNRDVHYFYHENDPYTLTSWGWTWMYPNEHNTYDHTTIMAVPEQVNMVNPAQLTGIGGVCTDYPYNWKT